MQSEAQNALVSAEEKLDRMNDFLSKYLSSKAGTEECCMRSPPELSSEKLVSLQTEPADDELINRPASQTLYNVLHQQRRRQTQEIDFYRKRIEEQEKEISALEREYAQIKT